MISDGCWRSKKVRTTAHRRGFGPGGAKRRDLFYQFAHKLEETREANHKAVFIDGRKLESRAGWYTFVWRKSAKKQALLERWEWYKETLSITREGHNSYSKTDPNTTFVHPKEDHKRNGQLKPEYNV